jgi:hypothetical protein
MRESREGRDNVLENLNDRYDFLYLVYSSISEGLPLLCNRGAANDLIMCLCISDRNG